MQRCRSRPLGRISSVFLCDGSGTQLASCRRMNVMTRLLFVLAVVVPSGLGAWGCAADTSADNQGSGSEPTLENDVENVMIGRSAAALNEAPGGGGSGGDCYGAYATCMDGCQQYNTRWDA